VPTASTTTAHYPGAMSAHYLFNPAALPPSLVRGALAPLSSRLSSSADWPSSYGQQINSAVVPTRVALTPNPSELFNAYAVSLDADRASSAATNHALQLAATDLEYEVTRVKSPVLGRDLNPMGRGDGTYYANGGNAALSASVAIRGAKPKLIGESTSGFGSSMNNQCCGAGAGGVGGTSPPGQLPEIPIHRLNDDPATHRRLKKPWPSDLFERLEYWAEIENRCVGNSTGVMYRAGIVYMYCQDKCLEDGALRFASKLLSLCKHPTSGKYECAVYVPDLPENRWQSIHEWDHWGTVLLWDCQQNYQSPLVKCLCGKKRRGISAAEVNDCIKQLFGGEVVRCSWTGGGGGGSGGTPPPPGGGGGGGDDGEPDKESILECLRRVADKWSKLGVNIDTVIDWLADCVEQAFMFFLACLAFGEKREVCLGQLRTQLRDCLDDAPTGLLEKYRDEILADIRECFEGAI